MPITSTESCQATTPNSSRLTNRARRARSRSVKATYGGGATGVVSPDHQPSTPASHAPTPARVRASPFVSTSMMPRLLPKLCRRSACHAHDTRCCARAPMPCHARSCRGKSRHRRWKYGVRLHLPRPPPLISSAQPHLPWHISCGLFPSGPARRLVPWPACRLAHDRATLVTKEETTLSSSMGTTGTSGGMAQGQGATGTPNFVYDLVSVLYHSLESGSTIQQYIQDAQQSGNNDLVQFFQQVQQQDKQRAQQAQQILSKISSSLPSH